MQDNIALPDSSEAGCETPAQTQVMSELVKDFDWSTTPLGPAAAWPDSLKAVVRIVLTSGFPMWMAWGPELTMLYNDAYARTTLGKKHPWALGRPAYQVWHEIWKDIGPLIERVMESGEACWEEVLQLILERNGYPEETYHTFSYSPLAGPDGNVAGMLCVVIEDTVRVIGERQLSALSTLAAALGGTITEQDVFAAIERGVAGQKDMPCTLTYLFDDDGKQLRLVAKTGFESDHPAACLIVSADSKAAPWPIHLLLAANRAITVEDLSAYFPALPPGCWDKPPARARLVPIMRQGQDKPVGVFIAALNPYRQLDATYGGFLDLVAGQTAASITNAKAYEEERQRAESLAELDRAKTAFFSNVSHELRTPLTLILGPVEDAITSGTPPSSGALEMLHRNALRLLKLVNGLLDFVRIEVGRLRAAYEPTDLSLLTAQLASVFRSAVERAHLKLVVDCPALPEPVYVDREMWEKIVLNLLSNALKSTFEGEIRLTMRSTGAEAQLKVTDTGTGISETDLPHLFERFRRIDGARRRSHEGSGIGLALVQELVELHGGTIAVESALGKGTTFTIALPFGQEHLSHGRVVLEGENSVGLQGSAVAYVQEAMGWLPGRDRQKREITRGTTGDGVHGTASTYPAESKPEILLVDDNADMREYVLGLLGWRFKVVPAENGRQALELAALHAPDLVLTDVMMPEMDGFGLLARLREHPATRAIPVIMLSARAGEEARIEGMDAGADDYLTKPFTARELVARVESQLKLARVRKEAAAQEAALTREIYQAKQFAWEALEHIPEVFYTFDSEFKFTYVNAAGEKVSSRMGKTLLGEKLFDLLPDLRGTIFEESVKQAMEQRIPTEFDYYYEPLESWFQYRVYPQPDNGLAMYARDITEERKTEEALRKSEQLAAAGRLAASIAHEINNPLEAVTNLLFLAKLDQSVAGNTKNLLELADKELQRLSHIAARSLKFYRQRTAATQTSLEELTESVFFFHETEIRTRGIDLDRRYRSATKVLCHPGEIQQVMTNLIDNALDALPRHGRMVVGVRPARDRAGREGVTVTVADNGCGMDRSTLERLFYPFITTKGEAGNGLGLWVSKGIVDKHQGTIAVRSRRDCGTVFRLFLPLNPTVSEADRA
jgi:signal transduction histidine kinase/DNA-binding NarL/FixJ family response regulator